MTDSNVENPVLELLRALRGEVQTLRHEMHDEFKDLKQRMSSIERASVASRGDIVDGQANAYRQQAAIDRLSERLERVERRLELAD
jgi:predicted  nucleic acid-binding Zn-ribbon protein